MAGFELPLRRASLRDAPPDVAGFVAALGTAGPFLERGTPVAIGRAPGRLDVMGGIADYSGSLVLQRPIREGTCVAVQRRGEPIIAIRSTGGRSIDVPVESLAPRGAPISYEAARGLFRAGTDQHWAAYVIGLFVVLMREGRLTLADGARMLIDSGVPEGKGVSSSAALETAAMAAITAAFHVTLSAEEIALLCQKAENLVAGAPCGVMDQMACVFGASDALMALLCQPAQRQAPVPIPDDIAFWGIDSGERHFVGGSDYAAVRTAAFMGLRIISARLKPGSTSTRAGLKPGATIRGPSSGVTYLAHLTPQEFEREFARELPQTMSGADFLVDFGDTSDTVTRVDPTLTYRVHQAAAHPVYEHDRVQRFRELMLAPADERRRREAGDLLYQSHASYSACGLGSPGTDRLVALVRAEGPAAGLYGARITGGGSGGTIVVLGRRDASRAIGRVVDAYAGATGYRPHVFSGSSPGVASCGVFEVSS